MVTSDSFCAYNARAKVRHLSEEAWGMNKQQLAAKIWESANQMRSKIEANEYKDYILGFIFYKYLSEQEEKWLHSKSYEAEDIQKYVNENAPDIYSGKSILQQNLGYFISYENLFSTWIRKGVDFSIDDVSVALSAFNRLISPTHKKVFEGIFQTLEVAKMRRCRVRRRAI